MNITEIADVKTPANLELIARKVVEGFIIGLHKSPFHGFSVEFAEHRLYQPGESIRNIDWKVYARSDKFFSKKYEEETNLRARIVIDVSSSMYFPKNANDRQTPFNKLQWSCLAAASLIQLLKKQRDAFGLTLFDEDMLYHSEAKSSTSHQQLLTSVLQPYFSSERTNAKTSAISTLHQIADAIHRRSLVIIFSDMLDNPDKLEPMFDALQHLRHNKHEVILFHVLDKSKEIDFDYENRPYEFIDLESGEKIKLQSNEIKKAYTEFMVRFENDLKLKSLQYKIDFVAANIRESFDKVLQSYLIKRSRMRV